MDIWLLEYEVCDGGSCETLYLQPFSSEGKAKEAFDKHLDRELLKGEDAINEWRHDNDDPDVQEFRTGNWGFCVWTLMRLDLDKIGEVAKTMHEQWRERFGDEDDDEKEDGGDPAG